MDFDSTKLNSIDTGTIHLVCGFVRLTIQTLMLDKVIPQELIDLCMIYYFIGEHFAILVKNVEISDEGMTVTAPTEPTAAFGHLVVDCNKSSSIYRWTLKITNLSMQVAVGVVDANQMDIFLNNTHFMYERSATNYAYGYSGRFYDSGRDGTQGSGYNNDDTVTIELNSKNKTISFYTNGKFAGDIKAIKPLQYKLAVHLYGSEAPILGKAIVTLEKFEIESPK